MAEKMTCPGCDAHLSSVLRAWRAGCPCPECGHDLTRVPLTTDMVMSQYMGDLDAFDRWLAAHDATVKAEALREAEARMDDISRNIGFETPADAVRAMKQVVRRVADRIEADS